MHGTVRYRDIFGKNHYTNFAYTVLVPRRGPSIWNAAAQHNDSD